MSEPDDDGNRLPRATAERMTCDSCGGTDDVEIVLGTALCVDCREHPIALIGLIAT